MKGSPEQRALVWAATGSTGASSKFMLAVMAGQKPKDRHSYPHDGGDLGRCLGLLKAVPEYRARLGEMKAFGAEWSALVDHWDELERLHGTDLDRCYDRMKAILDPLEAKRSDIIKFGSGASLRF